MPKATIEIDVPEGYEVEEVVGGSNYRPYCGSAYHLAVNVHVRLRVIPMVKDGVSSFPVVTAIDKPTELMGIPIHYVDKVIP